MEELTINKWKKRSTRNAWSIYHIQCSGYLRWAPNVTGGERSGLNQDSNPGPLAYREPVPALYPLSYWDPIFWFTFITCDINNPKKENIWIYLNKYKWIRNKLYLYVYILILFIHLYCIYFHFSFLIISIC